MRLLVLSALALSLFILASLVATHAIESAQATEASPF